jgi:hypothetical protein
VDLPGAGDGSRERRRRRRATTTTATLFTTSQYRNLAEELFAEHANDEVDTMTAQYFHPQAVTRSA